MSEAEAATTAALWLPMLAGIVGVFAAGIVLHAVDVVRERRQVEDLRRRLDAWERRVGHTLPAEWRYAAQGMLRDVVGPDSLSPASPERSLSHQLTNYQQKDS